jgi:hypothetical protein
MLNIIYLGFHKKDYIETAHNYKIFSETCKVYGDKF